MRQVFLAMDQAVREIFDNSLRERRNHFCKSFFLQICWLFRVHFRDPLQKHTLPHHGINAYP